MGIPGRVVHWMVTGELRREAPPSATPAPDPLTARIARLVDERRAAFTLRDAVSLPAVARGVQLLCSQAAALSPVVYADGVPADTQPRVVARPSALATRYDFVYQTVWSLILGGNRGGTAYWLVTDRDHNGNPSSLIVLDPAEVGLTWSPSRLRSVATWRGVEQSPDDLRVIRIGPRPGEVEGQSPLVAGLDRLAVIAAAEDFAAAWYQSGGTPEVVLKSGPALTDDEADELRGQYVGEGGPKPVRVVSGDIDLAFPGGDPAAAQLDAARAHGTTEVARLLGIPGPLLLIETSGATITYQNAQAALGQLYRETLVPTYLQPIGQAWSDLVPASGTVRFALDELMAADPTTRAQVQAAYVAMGALDPAEVRRMEGWPADTPIGISPALAGSPRPRPLRIDQMEVA